MQIFVRTIRGGSLVVHADAGTSVSSLKAHVEGCCGVPHEFQRLLFAGHDLPNERALEECGVGDGNVVTVALRLRGGKGGFGALLRGQGRDGKITSNYDACRDLTGRRLRHVNAEKKMDDWAKQAQERELEKIALQHLKDKAKEERKAKQKEFDLDGLNAQRNQTLAGVKDAVRAGLVNDSKIAGSLKRASPDTPSQPSKKFKHAFPDESDEDDDDLSEVEDLALFSVKNHKKNKPAVVGEPKQETAGSSKEPANVTPQASSSENDEKMTGTAMEVDCTEDVQENVAEGVGGGPIDLGKFKTAEELEVVGLERLKMELQIRGLKCGGTLKDRAKRLFLLKNGSLDSIDKKHLATEGAK